MISKWDIKNSEFNIFGRIGILLIITAVLFANYFMFNQYADKNIVGIWIFLGSQVFAVFFYVFIFIAWSALSLFFSICYWTLKGDWEFDAIIKFPKNVGGFLIKFICGDWNRADLFRKTK